MELLILTSLLLGSTLGGIVAKIISPILPFSLFNASIPGMSPNLLAYKTFDLVDFVFSVLVSILIFLVNFFVLSKLTDFPLKNYQKKVSWFFVASALVLFIQTHFVTSSAKIVIIAYFVSQIAFWVFMRFKPKVSILKEDSFIVLSNSLLIGFYLHLFPTVFTTNMVIGFFVLLTSVFIYFFAPLPLAYLKSPAHLLLLLSFFNPLSITYLLLVGVLFLLGLVLGIKFERVYERHGNIIRNYVYPMALIILFVYTPLYYVGSFDSVEEGFWYGWLQSMSFGKLLYKDVAVYHPPLIPWLMYGFTSIFGQSMKEVRLYLHLLQIVGFCMSYVFVNKLVKRSAFKVIVMLLLISLASNFVRNNVEIRVGVGLLALALWGISLEINKRVWIIASGVVSALSLLTSFEVGLASIVGISIVTLCFEKKGFKRLLNYLLGFVGGLVPVLLYLQATGALIPFWEQASFYASSFNAGYFNTPLERGIVISFLRWHLIWQYFKTSAFLNELVRMALLGTLMIVFVGVVKKQANKALGFVFQLSELDSTSKLALCASIFGLVLFRANLGRSDYYHLLFSLFAVVPLLFYMIEKLSINSWVSFSVSFLLLFVVLGFQVQEQYLSNLFYRYTTFGKVVEQYKHYDSPRSGILVGYEVNTDAMNDLVSEIQKTTAPTDKIFVYPWNPEVYFLSERVNATSFDTPYAFWSEKYQTQMINGLKENPPALMVVSENMNFGGLTPDALHQTYEYIKANYSSRKEIGPFKIYSAKSGS